MDNGMASNAWVHKMMETPWDNVSQGSKELSVANIAKIFMDTTKISD